MHAYMVQHMHDICAIHIRWNSVQGHPEVAHGKIVRVRARDREWIFHFPLKK